MKKGMRRALPMAILGLGLMLTLVGGFGVTSAGAIDQEVYEDDPYPDDDGSLGSTTTTIRETTTTVPETTTTVAETTTTVAETTTIPETTTTVAETTTTVLSSTTVQTPTSVLGTTVTQDPGDPSVQPAELAVTGIEHTIIAAVGVLLLVAGAVMLRAQAGIRRV